METGEVKAYKGRLEKEYLDLLGYRKGILAQIESEEKELGVAKRNKQMILQENARYVAEANQELEALKKQKGLFLESLEDRDVALMIREKLVDKLRKELKIKSDLSESSKKEYEKLTEALKNEKEILQKKIEGAGETRRNVALCEEEVKKVSQFNKLERERLRKEDREIRGIREKLEKERERLNLEKEALEKGREQIEREKGFIRSDRLHLESQQKTLKLAYEEAKKLYEQSDR